MKDNIIVALVVIGIVAVCTPIGFAAASLTNNQDGTACYEWGKTTNHIVKFLDENKHVIGGCLVKTGNNWERVRP